MSVTIPANPTLNRIPEKAIRLIVAVGKLPRVRAAMEAIGFTAVEVDEGLRLIRLVARPEGEGVAPPTGTDTKAREAARRLGAEGPSFLRRVVATLERHHAALALEVLACVDASVSPVVAVFDTLARIEALSTDPRPEAAAALALLESRGLGAATRQELSACVDIVTGRTPADAVPAGDPRIARQENLVALYRWYQEWSTMAREVVTQRHDLIVLGLAKPRRRAEVAESSSAPLADAPAVKVA